MQTITERLKEFFKQNKNQRILVGIGFATTFILMLILNYLFPRYLDDHDYGMVKFGESVVFPDDFIKVFEYMHFYYFNWGGRYVAHLLDHFVLFCSPFVQDLINTTFFICFVALTYRMSKVGKKHNILLFAIIPCLLISFVPRFFSDTCWITGSANYLWTTVLIFWFISYYHFSFFGKEYKSGVWRVLGIFILGVSAGWTNENMGPTVILVVLAYLIYFRVKKRVITKWQKAGLIGVTIGTLAMLLAPGNQVRAQAEGAHAVWLNSFSKMVDHAIFYVTEVYTGYVLPISLVFLGVFIIYLYTSKGDKNRSEILFLSLLFFMAGEAAFYATYFSPSFPPRAYYGIIAFKVLGAAILYANISFKKLPIRTVQIVALLALFLFSAREYCQAYNAIGLMSRTYKERVDMIIECKKKGIKDVVFHNNIELPYKYEYLELWQGKNKYWEQYYQMNSIVMEPHND